MLQKGLLCKSNFKPSLSFIGNERPATRQDAGTRLDLNFPITDETSALGDAGSNTSGSSARTCHQAHSYLEDKNELRQRAVLPPQTKESRMETPNWKRKFPPEPSWTIRVPRFPIPMRLPRYIRPICCRNGIRPLQHEHVPTRSS